MCIATSEVNGPSRCPADARAALEVANVAVRDAQQVVAAVRDELATASPERPEPSDPPAAPTHFAGMKRDERLEAMRGEIDTALAQLSTPGGWRDYLEHAAQMPRYSLYNHLLIRLQDPNATWCGGARNYWATLGRHPRAGCKAIWILAPRMQKVTTTDPATGEETVSSAMRGTVPVPVYDVDQTAGDPLPAEPVPMRLLEGQAPPGMRDTLAHDIEGKGFTVFYRPMGSTVRHPGGYTDFTAREVVINSDRSDAQQSNTLAHELAHIECGHGEAANEYHSSGPNGPSRPTMEVEAESVAYVICRRFGLDQQQAGAKSFGYIASWSKGDNKLVASTGDKVCTALRSIFNRIEPIKDTQQ